MNVLALKCYPMKDSNLQNKLFETIGVLRFPLIVLVVFAHMLPFEQQPVHLSWNSDEIYILVSEIISHYLGHLGVHCFFVFSGYFFFLKITSWGLNGYNIRIKKRIKTLVIPYIIWNLIMILAILAKNLVFERIGLGTDDGYESLQRFSVYELFWGVPINFPLWFLRDLIVMTLLSPLFYYFFLYAKLSGLILLFICYLLSIESGIPGLSTKAIAFFGLGSYLGLFKYNLLRVALPYGKMAGLVAVIALLFAIYTGNMANEFYRRVFVLFAVVAVFYAGYRITEHDRIKHHLLGLARPVFFIYAIHAVYILNWLKGALSKSSLAHSGWGMLVGYFMVPPICIGIILMLYAAMKRFLPKTLYLITGNRES